MYKKFAVFIAVLVLVLGLLSFGSPAQAKGRSGGSYYKSAKSGRFVTGSYSGSHRSTTYRSTFR